MGTVWAESENDAKIVLQERTQFDGFGALSRGRLIHPRISRCRLFLDVRNYEQSQFGEGRFLWQSLGSSWSHQPK
jgi:hypothetical protein